MQWSERVREREETKIVRQREIWEWERRNQEKDEVERVRRAIERKSNSHTWCSILVISLEYDLNKLDLKKIPISQVTTNFTLELENLQPSLFTLTLNKSVRWERERGGGGGGTQISSSTSSH